MDWMTESAGTWGLPMESRCGVLEEEKPGLSESDAWPCS
jgi:hypothetical protein